MLIQDRESIVGRGTTTYYRQKVTHHLKAKYIENGQLLLIQDRESIVGRGTTTYYRQFFLVSQILSENIIANTIMTNHCPSDLNKYAMHKTYIENLMEKSFGLEQTLVCFSCKFFLDILIPEQTAVQLQTMQVLMNSNVYHIIPTFSGAILEILWEIMLITSIFSFPEVFSILSDINMVISANFKSAKPQNFGLNQVGCIF